MSEPRLVAEVPAGSRGGLIRVYEPADLRSTHVDGFHQIQLNGTNVMVDFFETLPVENQTGGKVTMSTEAGGTERRLINFRLRVPLSSFAQMLALAIPMVTDEETEKIALSSVTNSLAMLRATQPKEGEQ